MPPRLLAFAGSARRESWNKLVLAVAVDGARSAGAEVTVVDLADHPMPLYDGDLEAADGLPEHAKELKAEFARHDGLLLACPEYNSSITPLLKNTIDWVSRPVEGEPPLVAFRGKTAGLVAGSPGGLGGLRGLVTVRSILGNIGMVVLPDQMAVPKVHEAFDADGNPTDERIETSLRNVGAELAKLTARVASVR